MKKSIILYFLLIIFNYGYSTVFFATLTFKY